MGKYCVICGRPSGKYPLCYIHLNEKNKGNVVKCTVCKAWHYVDRPCNCPAYHSDRSCPPRAAQQYRSRSSYRNARYTCVDGHIVKSKSERDIDNYLYYHNIRHVYEKEIRINGSLSIHPDFYLPDLDVYLEHWGFGESNEKYTQDKLKKLDFYRANGFTLICTYEESDAEDIESALDYKLNHFRPGEVNFESWTHTDRDMREVPESSVYVYTDDERFNLWDLLQDILGISDYTMYKIKKITYILLAIVLLCVLLKIVSIL